MGGARMVMVITALVVSATCVAGATAGQQAATAGPAYKVVGKWGKDGSANGQFRGPNGIVTDGAGNVYVADTDNNRIQVFSASGAFIRKWGGIGGGPGQFSVAEDIDIASDGTVWVADQGNVRLQAFTSAGAFRASLAADQTELPRGIAVDPDGNVFAAVDGEQNGGIRRYEKTASGWREPGVLLGVGRYRPEDVEASADGSVYVVGITDSDNPLVRRFSGDGRAMGSFKLAVASQRGIAVDLDCNVWAADLPQRRIVKYSPSGKLLATASAPDLIAADITVAPKGDIYVIAQNAGIVRFAEDKSKPASANIPGKVTVSKGPLVRIPYTLSGVACPSEVGATASLKGKGISGTAAGLKLKAGKKNVIEIRLAKGALKGAAASGKATFKIVLKTNGRPTTEMTSITVVVPKSVK